MAYQLNYGIRPAGVLFGTASWKQVRCEALRMLTAGAVELTTNNRGPVLMQVPLEEHPLVHPTGVFLVGDMYGTDTKLSWENQYEFQA